MRIKKKKIKIKNKEEIMKETGQPRQREKVQVYELPKAKTTPFQGKVLAMRLMLENKYTDLEIAEIVLEVTKYLPRVDELRWGLNRGAYVKYSPEFVLKQSVYEFTCGKLKREAKISFAVKTLKKCAKEKAEYWNNLQRKYQQIHNK